MTTRTLRDIALEIKTFWLQPYFGARPYIDAMLAMRTGADGKYGAEDGRNVIRYFLANAQSFKGPDARRIKAELKEMAGIK
jgi:hypothetical protein